MNIETELGSLKINNTLYAKVIYQAISLTNNEMFLCSQNKKILATKERKGSTNFLAQNIEVNENDNIQIKFYVIAKFGYSITTNSSIVLNNVVKDLSGAFPNKKILVLMKVIGVKSKNIAERDLEFYANYEP